jgi:hypothetical protein
MRCVRSVLLLGQSRSTIIESSIWSWLLAQSTVSGNTINMNVVKSTNQFRFLTQAFGLHLIVMICLHSFLLNLSIHDEIKLLLYFHILKLMEIECDECSQKLNDNAELAIHQRERHQKSYCGACRKEFANLKELNKHVKDTHGIIIPSNSLD